MTTRIKFLSLFLLMSFSILQSCTKDAMDEVGTVYTGPDVVEFAHLAGPLSRSIPYTATQENYTDSIKIQLVGKLRSTPTNVTYRIDASSTAVAGVDYIALTTSNTTVTIPANESIFWLKFQFKRPATGTKTLRLDLVSADNAGLSANYKTMIFTWKR